MTTGKRIVVSLESARAMLAEWKAQRDQAEREAAAEAVHADRDRTYRRTPAEYADDLAPYVFSLLEKHSEKP